MRYAFQTIFIFLLMVKGIHAQTYSWPLFPAEYKVSSTFGEYRGSNTPHFHEGIDIPANTSKTVFPVTLVFEVLSIGQLPNSDYIVKVRHYADDTTSLNEGSAYLHMWDIDYLQIGVIYVGNPISTSAPSKNW